MFVLTTRKCSNLKQFIQFVFNFSWATKQIILHIYSSPLTFLKRLLTSLTERWERSREFCSLSHRLSEVRTRSHFTKSTFQILLRRKFLQDILLISP